MIEKENLHCDNDYFSLYIRWFKVISKVMLFKTSISKLVRVLSKLQGICHGYLFIQNIPNFEGITFPNVFLTRVFKNYEYEHKKYKYERGLLYLHNFIIVGHGMM